MKELDEPGAIRTYVISLNRSTERRTHMKKYVDEGFEFVDAVDGMSFPFDQYQDELLRLFGSYRMQLAKTSVKEMKKIALDWTYYRIFTRVLRMFDDQKKELNLQAVLFMEDDVFPVPGYMKSLKKVLKTLPNDWDIFLLRSTAPVRTGLCVPEDGYCVLRSAVGTQAFVLSRSGVQKVLGVLKWAYSALYIDLAMMGLMVETMRINAYIADPFLCEACVPQTGCFPSTINMR